MRRRQNPQSPMSLFPFLDTLVCTMGSLILMLLAMTPKIKERAEARELARLAALAPLEAAEPEPEPEPVAAPPEVTRAPVVDLAAIHAEHEAERKKRRAAWYRSVEEARAALAKKQAELRRERELLKQADAQVKQIEDQTLQARLKSEAAAEASQSVAERKAQLEEQEAQVAQAIALTRKNIDLANRQQASAKNEFSLVPYDGTSGTVRRPIYIECTARGFRFLPEDETVSPIDLQEFRASYNPLLTGTQQLVRYWSRRRRSAGGDEPEPYVLLLVRPTGALNYYVAREFLSSLGLNFGYELIEEDWKLSLPEADPIAKSVLKETLDLTVQTRRPGGESLADSRRDGGLLDELQRAQLAKAYPSRAGGTGSGDPGSENGAGARKSPIHYGPATRAARDPALNPGDDELADAAAAAGLARNGGGAGIGNRSGGGAALAGRTPKGRPAGISGRGEDEFAPGGAGAGGQIPSRAGARGAGNGDAATSELADALAPGGSSGGAGGRGGPGGLAGGSRLRGNGRGGARPATLSGSAAEPGGEGTGDGDDLPPELTSDYVPGRLRGPDGRGTPGGDPDGDPTGLAGGIPSRSRKGQTPLADGATSRSANSSDLADSGADGSSSADQGTPGSAGGGQSSSKVQMGGPGVNVSLGGKKRRVTDKEDPDDGPRIAEDNARSGGFSGRATGPRKWGQAHRKASIGFEKKIVIRVSSRRIVIGNNDAVIGVGRADSNDDIVHQVVAGIDHTADGWGEPPNNFYWVPVAKFIVAPDGSANYEKLHNVLEQKWGISSTVEYESETKGGKPAGGGRP